MNEHRDATVAAFILAYRVHFLIGIFALLMALTFAHPTLFVTDEWISVNQLSQLQNGHQVLYNEGKYGYYENGTPKIYFSARENYLTYPLFLPIIALPANTLINLTGDHFVFLILYLWTFLFIILVLLLNAYFPEWASMWGRRWTSGLLIVAFTVFFFNLMYYRQFPLTGETSYPEVMAVVVTNIFLFAILAVMICEVCRLIFRDTSYAAFATLTCISCSSYLFWTSFCKDHVLVALLVTLIIFFLIKFIHETNIACLAGSFIMTGLLAWARPELALFVFFATCIFVLYSRFCSGTGFQKNERLAILLSPFCTIIGAIPFFLNNHLINGNIFLPPFIRGTTILARSGDASQNIAPIQQNVFETMGSIFSLSQWGASVNPLTLMPDVVGIFFFPQNGSIGVFLLVPVFIIALVIILHLAWNKKMNVISRDRSIFLVLSLISLGVFFAYFNRISGMNFDLGIVPDIRYLSPLYLPLTLIGLMIIRTIPVIREKPKILIRMMIGIWIVLIPLSLVTMRLLLPPVGEEWAVVNLMLSYGISVLMYSLIALFIILLVYIRTFQKTESLLLPVLALTCSLPLIWQIDASFVARLYGVGLGGYNFWIPIVLKGFVAIFGSDVTIQNLLF